MLILIRYLSFNASLKIIKALLSASYIELLSNNPPSKKSSYASLSFVIIIRLKKVDIAIVARVAF